MTRLAKPSTATPVTRQKAQVCSITDMSLEQRLKRKRRAKVFAGDEEEQPGKKHKQLKLNPAPSSTKPTTAEVLVGYRLRKRIRDAGAACSPTWPPGQFKLLLKINAIHDSDWHSIKRCSNIV